MKMSDIDKLAEDTGMNIDLSKLDESDAVKIVGVAMLASLDKMEDMGILPELPSHCLEQIAKMREFVDA